MGTMILGIDFGTSSLKAVLLRPDGSTAAQAEARYVVDHPRDGWSEADPATWTDALDATLGDLAAHTGAGTRVAAVGIAGQMHAAVLVDAECRPVRPAVLWTDRRADLGPWRALAPTLRAPLANPLAPGMTGPILTWLAAHEPDVLAETEAVLLPKDYVRSWLVTDPALPVATTDRSDAAGTLLWDVIADDWALPIADALAIPTSLLPHVAASDAVAGTTSRLTRWFPASGDTVPVVVGAGDTPAARLAVGSPALQLNLGTGAQVIGAVDAPVACADPIVHTYADTDTGWYAMAAIQNAGLAVDWARHALGFGWDDLFEAAAHVPDGARGVSFLPFLTGERGAVAAPGSRGAWIGLTETTGREELVRAVVEGMVFAVRRGVDLIRSGDTPAEIVATGGGMRDGLVHRLLADALGLPVRKLDVRSATALGAALLAARGVGARLEPAVGAGIVREPRPAPSLDAAYDRWLRAAANA